MADRRAKLGTLFVDLELKLPDLNASIGRSKSQVEALGRDINRQFGAMKFHLAPTVDLSNLHALNREFDRKEAHHKRLQRHFDQNPLTIKFDFKNLDALEQRLNKLTTGTIGISTSSSGNSSNKALADEIGRSVARYSRGGVVGTIGRAVGAVASVPLKLAGNAASGVAQGLTEGVTREVTTNFGKGVTTAIERSISGSFGSTELIGERLGTKLIDSTVSGVRNGLNNLPKAVNEAIQLVGAETNLPSTIFRRFGTRAEQQLKAEIAKLKKTAEEGRQALTEVLGQENINREGLFQRGSILQNREQRDPTVQKQAVAEWRKAIADIDRAEATFQKRVNTARQYMPEMRQDVVTAKQDIAEAQKQIKLFEKLQSQLSAAEKQRLAPEIATKSAELQSNLSEAFTNFQSARSQRDFIGMYRAPDVRRKVQDRLSQVNSRLESIQSDPNTNMADQETAMLVNRLNAYKAMLEGRLEKVDKVAQAIQKPIEVAIQKAKAAQEKFNQVPSQVANLPKAYERALNIATGGKNLRPDQIPRLQVADRALDKTGSNAEYNAAQNVIRVRKELFDAIQQDMMSAEQTYTLLEEVFHANQMDFGSFEGIQSSRQNRSTKPMLSPQGDLSPDMARELSAYSPETRAVEYDAKIRAKQAVPQFMGQQQGARQMQFNADIAKNTVLFNEAVTKVSKNLSSAVAAAKELEEIPADISDRMKTIGASLIKLKQGMAELEKTAMNFDAVDPAEIAKALDVFSSTQNSLISKLGQQGDQTSVLQKVVEKRVAEWREVLADRLRIELEELLKQFSKKKALVPLSQEMGIEGGQKLSKSALIQRLVTESDLNQLKPRVYEMTREKAQRDLARREQLQDMAESVGFNARRGMAVARQTMQAGSGVLRAGGDAAQQLFGSPAGQAMLGAGKAAASGLVQVSKASFMLASGMESIALDLMPAGRMIKGALQQTVLPAGIAIGATHLLGPAGGMMADAAVNMTGGAIAPLGHSAAASVSGMAAEALSGIPNIMGLQTAITGAITGSINAGFETLISMAAPAIAAIGAGKVIQTGAQIPLNLIQKQAEPMLALPGSSQQSQQRALPGSSKAEIVKSKQQAEQIAKDAGKTLNKVVESVQETISSTKAALQKADQISKSFREAYKNLQAAIKSGDAEKAQILLGTIKENADRAKQEIRQLTAGLSEEEKASGNVIAKLSNRQSQISRAANLAESQVRKMKPADIPTNAIDVSSVRGEDTTLQQRMDFARVQAVKGIGPDQYKEVQQLNKAFSEAEKTSDRFDAAFKRLAATSEQRFTVSAKGAAKSMEDLTESVLNGGDAAQEASKSMTWLGALQKGLGGVAENAAIGFDLIASSAGPLGPILNALGKGALANLSAVAVFGAGFLAAVPMLKEFGSASLQAAQNLESLRAQFSGALGRTSGMQGLEKATEYAVQFKADINSARESYLQFAASVRDTPMEGVTDLAASSLSQAQRVRGLSDEQIMRARVALTQSLAKGGALQSEEVRGQLAEALPGSTATFARALGLTQSQFSSQLRSGNIQAADAIPKFLAQLQAETSTGITDSVNTTAASFTDLRNQTQLLQEKFGKLLLPIQKLGVDVLASRAESLVGVFDGLGKAANLLTESFNLLKGVLPIPTGGSGGAVGNAVGTISNPASWAQNITQPLADGFLNWLDTTRLPLRQNQRTVSGNQAIDQSNQAIGNMMSALTSGADGAEYQRISAQLRDVQSRRNALTPDQGNERTALMEQERQLMNQRNPIEERIRGLSAANAAAIEKLKELRKEAEQAAANATDPKKIQQYRDDAEKYGRQLNANNQAQERFNQILKDGIVPASKLKSELERITGKLNEANQANDILQANAKTNLASDRLSGISEGIASYREFIDVQQDAARRIADNNAAIAKTAALLNDVETQRVLAANKFNNSSSPTDIRNKANTMDEGADKERLNVAADQIEAINQTRQTNAAAVSQLREAQASYVQRQRELAKSIYEFYRGIEQQAAETAIQTQQLIAQSNVSNAQNRLKTALIGFQESFTNDFVESLISLIETLNKPLNDAISAQQQILSAQNQYVSQLQQASQLQQQLPNGAALNAGNGALGGIGGKMPAGGQMTGVPNSIGQLSGNQVLGIQQDFNQMSLPDATKFGAQGLQQGVALAGASYQQQVANIQKQLQQSQAMAQLEAQTGFANAQFQLQRANREITSQGRSGSRAVEDLQLQGQAQTPDIQLRQQLQGLYRQYDDQIRSFGDFSRGLNQTLEQQLMVRDQIVSGALPEQFKAFLPQINQTISNVTQQLSQLNQNTEAYGRAYEAAVAEVRKQAEIAAKNRARDAANQVVDARMQVSQQRVALLRSQGAGAVANDLELRNSIESANIAFSRSIQQLEESARLNPQIAEKAGELRDAFAQLRDTTIQAAEAEYERQQRERDFQAQQKTLGLRSDSLNIQGDILRQQAVTPEMRALQAKFSEGGYSGETGAKLKELKAQSIQLTTSFRDAMDTLRKMREAGEITSDRFRELADLTKTNNELQAAKIRNEEAAAKRNQNYGIGSVTEGGIKASASDISSVAREINKINMSTGDMSKRFAEYADLVRMGGSKGVAASLQLGNDPILGRIRQLSQQGFAGSMEANRIAGQLRSGELSSNSQGLAEKLDQLIQVTKQQSSLLSRPNLSISTLSDLSTAGQIYNDLSRDSLRASGL